jgi:RNA polymerase sigma factor (sigma-70 family)
MLSKAIEDLPERERTVVLRFMANETLTAIAEDLGINKSSVSRTLDRAFETLVRALRPAR